jgi:hypothetical protein
VPARPFGDYGERVERAADLKPALQRAMDVAKAGDAAFLEFITAEQADFPGGNWSVSIVLTDCYQDVRRMRNAHPVGSG